MGEGDPLEKEEWVAILYVGFVCLFLLALASVLIYGIISLF